MIIHRENQAAIIKCNECHYRTFRANFNNTKRCTKCGGLVTIIYYEKKNKGRH